MKVCLTRRDSHGDSRVIGEFLPLKLQDLTNCLGSHHVQTEQRPAKGKDTVETFEVSSNGSCSNGIDGQASLLSLEAASVTHVKTIVLENVLDHYTQPINVRSNGIDKQEEKEEKALVSTLQPVNIFSSVDAYLLRERGTSSPYDPVSVATMPSTSKAKQNDDYDLPATKFGVVETIMQEAKYRGHKSQQNPYDMPLSLRIFQPSPQCMSSSMNYHSQYIRGDWTRRLITTDMSYSDNSNARESSSVRVNLVDLTPLQRQRRNTNPTMKCLRMDTPGAVFHLLQSILSDTNGSSCHVDEGDTSSGFLHHSTSPWKRSYIHLKAEETFQDRYDGISAEHNDDIFALLLSNRLNRSDKSDPHKHRRMEWDDLEEAEIRELLKFRVGDCSPNFYLHSATSLLDDFDVKELVSALSHGSFQIKENLHEACGGKDPLHVSNRQNPNGATLFVYRHLPQRYHLSTQIEDDALTLHPSDSILRDRHILPKGCLWERMRIEPDSLIHRLVAPPYQCHCDIYPGLLDELITPQNLKMICEEVQRIPQWTAWPERNHYSSDYDDSIGKGAVYPASWTVFPLCYCFPATDLDARRFINKTCDFVPGTTRLLRKVLGSCLRTALFSRLEPRTRLEPHTGWSDLANHVLRVHVPLVIPTGVMNDGLCGTWVDGCVETHEVGKIICFDDSKVHRAFNYSDEERIVLILDLVRPDSTHLNDDYFPTGTSTGGHTSELDDFIRAYD